jgi:hypothetical protein
MNVKDVNAAIAEMHDAVLLSVGLDWEKGVGRISVRTARGSGSLVVEGVRSLVCPRQFPWGRSVSVNEVAIRKSPAPEEGLELTVEMQSGDVLLMVGSSIAVQD